MIYFENYTQATQHIYFAHKTCKFVNGHYCDR